MKDKKFHSTLRVYLYIALFSLFFLNDWRLAYNSFELSFSDIFLLILFPTILCLFYFNKPNDLKNKFLIKKTFMFLGILSTFLILHTVLVYIVYEIDLIIAGYSIIKVILYLLMVSMVSGIVLLTDDFESMYRALEKVVLLIVFVGLVINLLIYFYEYLQFPFKWIWFFTRTDEKSYILRGSDIIRMRSLFSEPAHLGAFLNIVISINYFNRKKLKFQFKPTRLLIIISILLTFSFSAIMVYSIIELMNQILLRRKNINFPKKITRNQLRNKVILISLLILLMFLLREQIYYSIIIRIGHILTGVDGSATSRLFGSWTLSKNFFIGNGINQTPLIFNVLAYIYTDFGIFILVLYLYCLFYLFGKNYVIYFSYLLISFSKGGYLSAFHFLTLMLFFLANSDNFFEVSKPKFQRDDINTLVATVSLSDDSHIYNMNLEGNVIICNQTNFMDYCKSSGLNKYGETYDYSLISTNTIGVGTNRNIGILYSKTKLSVIADDDMIFKKNYRNLVLKAFGDLPTADIILFNIDGEKFESVNTNRIKKINHLNYMKYGAARIVFNTRKIKEKNIYFHRDFGGGARYSSGEDTIFLKNALDNKLQIYAYPLSLSKIVEVRDSTWFEGYTHKYFHDKAILFKNLYPYIYPLVILQFITRKATQWKGNFKFTEVIKIMFYTSNKKEGQ